jgi:O-antigen/teichoic acid export membrane protein
MDVLMLGVFTNARSVAFYTLAGSIAAAANLPVLGLSTALFAPMARARKIRGQVLVIGAALGLITALAAWALAKPFIELVFSNRYASAAVLVLPLSLAQAVRGLTGFYNTFLAAQGEGRALRNAGIVLTVSNLVFNFALIPPFGAMGAAWASLFALVANLGAHIMFYRRALESRELQPPE